VGVIGVVVAVHVGVGVGVFGVAVTVAVCVGVGVGVTGVGVGVAEHSSAQTCQLRQTGFAPGTDGQVTMAQPFTQCPALTVPIGSGRPGWLCQSTLNGRVSD